MESKKINQLATNVNPQTSDLTTIGDPITGQLKKITWLQVAHLIGAQAAVTLQQVTDNGNTTTDPITTGGLTLTNLGTGLPRLTNGEFVSTYGYGLANGVATLDSGGKIPASQLPSSVMEYKGTWNASTNTPTLADGTGDNGDVYLVNVAGSQNLGSGTISFAVGDWVVYNGTIWQKSLNSNAVSSVFGRTGTITAQEGDYTIDQLGDVAITTPATNDYLRYNGTGWVNTQFPTFVSSDKLVLQVRNNSGATINKGTVVYINGATAGYPTIAKAQANQDSTSAQTLGLVQDNISNNSNGIVVLVGQITGIDTSAYPAGTQLYLSGTTAGAFTSTKTLAPTHLVYVGIVTTQNAVNGVIEVKIQNGYELDEIHDVAISSVANNQGLFYESSTSLWKNKSIATVLGYTPEQPLTFSAPLSRSTNTVSIPAATGSVNGYLSSTDWTTFNNKMTNPMTTLGDIIFGGTSGNPNRLAGNTTTTKQYLSQTGTGTDSASPVWATITGSDITGAALTKSDDTNVTLTLGGTPATALLRAASLTLGWTGQLAISRGGTGLSALGTAGQLLRVNSGATALEYFTPTYISAAITSLNGLTAATQTFATGTTGTDFAISSASGVHTFNIPNASETARGLITTGSQSISGSKTFKAKFIVEENLVNATSFGGIVLQKTGEAPINIIGTTYSSIYFGDAANNLESGIVYDHATNSIEFRRSGNVTALTIAPTGNALFSNELKVNANLNQVALFQSPNVSTWIDLISTTATWSIGSTSDNSFDVYSRSSNPEAIRFRVQNTASYFYTSLTVDNILTVKGSTNSIDNARFQNTDGSYSYIRVTALSNTNNTWFDGSLGSTTWINWWNPGQASTANTYSKVAFGTGRATENEAVYIERAVQTFRNTAGTTTITLHGLNGTASFSSTGFFGDAIRITSNAATISSGLAIGIANNNAIRWRNAANTANHGFYLGADDLFVTDKGLNVNGDLKTLNGGDIILTPATSGVNAVLYNDIGKLVSSASLVVQGTIESGNISIDSSGNGSLSINSFEGSNSWIYLQQAGSSLSAISTNGPGYMNFKYLSTTLQDAFYINLDGNILYPKTQSRVFGVAKSDAGNAAGGNLTVKAGGGVGSGASGHLYLGAGAGGATNGNIYLGLASTSNANTAGLSATYLTILAGGASTFSSSVTASNIIANSPSAGATGEGIIAGTSFKIDATGTGQKAKMYVVSKDLSDTYGSGLQIQFANQADDKGFGFNLNTSGGYETYVKSSANQWVRQMLINQSGRVTMPNQPSLLAQPDSATTFTTTGGSTNCYGWNTSGGIRFNVGFTLTGSTVAVNNVANGQNTGKITVPAAGKYLINISIRNETEKGSTGQMYVWVNGTMRIRRHIELWDFNDYIHSDITAVIDLSANDYLEFGAWWNAAGVNGGITGTNDTVNWLSIVKVN